MQLQQQQQQVQHQQEELISAVYLMALNFQKYIEQSIIAQ